MKANEIKRETIAKASKKDLVNYLRVTKMGDKNLTALVKSALQSFDKDMNSVKKTELVDLVKKVVDFIDSKNESAVKVVAPVEASLKPKKSGKSLPSKKSKKAEKPVEDEEEETEVEETEEVEEVPEKTKKSSKKVGGITRAKKQKEEVESLPAASNVGSDNLPSAKMFPKEINHPELGKIVAMTGKFTTYQEVLEALNEDKTLYFACYWTKRQIREFQYAAAKMIDPKVVKNGFPYDLDILMAVLPCETMERVFAMSRITEALFQFEGEDFKPVEDTDPRSGEKFQIRVSAGMEFEIYRPESELEEEANADSDESEEDEE